MKKVLIAMLAMFLLTVWPGAAIWVSVLPHILGVGISESFLYPLYGGIILLAGIVVFCTELVLDELKALKEEIKNCKTDEQ